MAKVNSCFKGVFILFNVLFAIAGGALLALGILGHVFYSENEQFNTVMVGVVVLYIVGGLTMVISLLGVYGAYKERKWALIVFCTAMALGFCGFLRIAIPIMISRPQIKSELEEQLHSVIPLDEANPKVKQAAEMFQTQLKCCGIFNGYQDWGTHIPRSCLCAAQDQQPDKCEVVERSLLEAAKVESFLERLTSDSENLVYREPCFPVLLKNMDKNLNVALGIFFGFSFMALIGFMMSLVLIWYINGHHIHAPAMFSMNPAMFSVNPSPPKYSELYNAS